MKIVVTLEKQDFDSMHDVVMESIDIEPTNDQIQKIWDNLPDHVKGTALEWGTNDSVFRDNLYVYLQENSSTIKELIS